MARSSNIIKLVIAFTLFLCNSNNTSAQERSLELYIRIAIEDFCEKRHSTQSDIYHIEIEDISRSKRYDLEFFFNPCDTLDGFYILKDSENIQDISWVEYNGKLFYWRKSTNVKHLNKELLDVLDKYNFYSIVDSCEYYLAYRPWRYYPYKTVVHYYFNLYKGSTQSPEFRCRTINYKGRPKNYFK